MKELFFHFTHMIVLVATFCLSVKLFKAYKGFGACAIDSAANKALPMTQMGIIGLLALLSLMLGLMKTLDIA